MLTHGNGMRTTSRTPYRSRATKRDPVRDRRAKARRKFLAYFPDGFDDEDYVAAERAYKMAAHERWLAVLGREQFEVLLEEGRYDEIVGHAVRTEGRTHLLFSFEKMALRDAVRDRKPARTFAEALYERLHGRGSPQQRFDAFTEALDALPRRQSRVLTWPVHTVWGFLALPTEHLYVKPRVLQKAAEVYGYDFRYESRPNWETYASALALAEQVRTDMADLGPRDMVDLQSFLWVLGSDEYPG